MFTRARLLGLPPLSAWKLFDVIGLLPPKETGCPVGSSFPGCQLASQHGVTYALPSASAQSGKARLWTAWHRRPVTSVAVLCHQFFDGGWLAAASSPTPLHPKLDSLQLSRPFPWGKPGWLHWGSSGSVVTTHVRFLGWFRWKILSSVVNHVFVWHLENTAPSPKCCVSGMMAPSLLLLH